MAQRVRAVAVTTQVCDCGCIEQFDRLRREQAELRGRIERLEQRRGPRDQQDHILLKLLAESTRALPFRSEALRQHAGVDERLHDALEAADVTTAAEIGCWLRRHVGDHGAVRVERLGRRWRVRHIAHIEVHD